VDANGLHPPGETIDARVSRSDVVLFEQGADQAEQSLLFRADIEHVEIGAFLSGDAPPEDSWRTNTPPEGSRIKYHRSPVGLS
jgi:hypothetical protein